jgi:hypothetical protein
MAEIEPSLVEAARALVAEDERTKKASAKNATNERLSQLLEMALTRMDGDPEQAANLFVRWAEQDDQVRSLLQILARDAIEARLAKIQPTIA